MLSIGFILRWLIIDILWCISSVQFNFSNVDNYRCRHFTSEELEKQIHEQMNGITLKCDCLICQCFQKTKKTSDYPNSILWCIRESLSITFNFHSLVQPIFVAYSGMRKWQKYDFLRQDWLKRHSTKSDELKKKIY